MTHPSRRRRLAIDEIETYKHVASGVLDRVRLVRTSFLPPAADGLTIGRFVFLRGDRITRSRSKLIAHELVHVRQFAELGAARFIGRYVSEYVRNLVRTRSHRQAYLDISLEVEARAEADRWAAET